VITGLAWASIAAQLQTRPDPPDNTLTEKEKEEGWTLLFDGTLEGWMTNNREPSRTPVEQNAINPHKSGGYMVIPDRQWRDFVLSLDFKLTKGCNSGVFIRTNPLGDDATVGYRGLEVQLLDSRGAGFHDTGAIYDLVKPKKNAMKPAGEWNRMIITAKDNLIEVELNGEKITHMDLNEWTQAGKRPDGSDHKFRKIAWKTHPRHGYIGFQDHGGACWFKNIKLKPLTKLASTTATGSSTLSK
jgi:hypothetical protein